MILWFEVSNDFCYLDLDIFADKCQCEVAVLWLKGIVVSFVHFVLYYSI